MIFLSNNNVLANLKVELQKISEACHTPYDTIARDFVKEYKSDYVTKDKSFKDDEARARYCLNVVTIKYGDRQPAYPYNVIPVGIGSVRTDKSKKKYVNLIVLINGKVRRVMVKNPSAIDNIVFDNEYKDVLLSPFAKDSDTCDLAADDRAVFKQPVYINGFDFDAYAKPEEVAMHEIDLYPSKTDKSGWALTSDFKKVRGFIAQKMSGKTKESGDPWGMYRLKSGYGAIELGSGKVTDSVTVWLDPSIMRYDIESECYFYGTISIDEKDKTPSMNVYRITPIHAKEVDSK